MYYITTVGTCGVCVGEGGGGGAGRGASHLFSFSFLRACILHFAHSHNVCSINTDFHTFHPGPVKRINDITSFDVNDDRVQRNL